MKLAAKGDAGQLSCNSYDPRKARKAGNSNGNRLPLA